MGGRSSAFGGLGKFRKQQARQRDQHNARLRNLERSNGWTAGGTVDGEPAVTRQEGARTEALWGGSNPEGDGAGHGHIITNDGINAAHVQYPGEDEPFMHNPDDKRQR